MFTALKQNATGMHFCLLHVCKYEEQKEGERRGRGK